MNDLPQLGETTPDEVTTIAKVRIVAVWRNLSAHLATVQFYLYQIDRVGDAHSPVVLWPTPFVVLRRFSGGEEQPELTAIAFLKGLFEQAGAYVTGLSTTKEVDKGEETQWYYEATLGVKPGVMSIGFLTDNHHTKVYAF